MLGGAPSPNTDPGECRAYRPIPYLPHSRPPPARGRGTLSFQNVGRGVARSAGVRACHHASPGFRINGSHGGSHTKRNADRLFACALPHRRSPADLRSGVTPAASSRISLYVHCANLSTPVLGQLVNHRRQVLGSRLTDHGSGDGSGTRDVRASASQASDGNAVRSSHPPDCPAHSTTSGAQNRRGRAGSRPDPPASPWSHPCSAIVD